MSVLSPERTSISLRIPVGLKERLSEYASLHDLSLTDAAILLMLSGLNDGDTGEPSYRLSDGFSSASSCSKSPKSLDSGVLAQFEKRLAYLENQVQRLSYQTKSALTLSEIKDITEQLFSEYPQVKRVYLFGSFARNDARADSDVDLRVEYATEQNFTLNEFLLLQKRAEKAFGRDVDIITSREIKDAEFAAQIEKDKVLVYERKEQ